MNKTPNVHQRAISMRDVAAWDLGPALRQPPTNAKRQEEIRIDRGGTNFHMNGDLFRQPSNLI